MPQSRAKFTPQRAKDANRSTLPPSERLVPLIEHNVARRPGRQAGRTLIAAGDTRITSVVSPEQWMKLLGLVASGVKQSQAIQVLGIDPTALEGWLRADPMKYRSWREAIIAADRIGWSVEALEGICTELSNRKTLEAACMEWGKSPMAFLQLVRRDPTIKEMYDEARVIATELEADTLKGISDDDANDLTLDGKGNTASVNRSKLRVETRLRLMAAFNRDRYAEQKGGAGGAQANVTVNINHADRLESARARHKKVIEGEAIEVLETRGTQALIPADEDTSWLD